MKLNLFPLVLALACGAAQAQTVDVQDAWVRLTVPGQQATGAFMKITARQNARLVSVTTPVAGVAEVHEMKMDGGVMTMRAVSGGLALPAGKTVELRPGGFHLMLMDLKSALPRDSRVPMTLVFRDDAGAESRLELMLPVAASAVAATRKP